VQVDGIQILGARADIDVIQRLLARHCPALAYGGETGGLRVRERASREGHQARRFVAGSSAALAETLLARRGQPDVLLIEVVRVSEGCGDRDILSTGQVDELDGGRQIDAVAQISFPGRANPRERR